MRRTVFVLAGTLLFSSLMLWGCSSSPTKDELKQLETTQAEITSLAQKANTLKQQKAALQLAMSEKQAKLSTCQDDKSAVAARLKSMN